MAAVAVLCFAATLWQAYIRASIPLEMNYEEGNVLNAGLRVLKGSTAYPDPASFPYTFNPYGPVGYLLTAAGIKLFGLSLFGPRLFVLLAGAIAVFVIAGLTRGLGGGWRIGFFMGVMFLSAPLARSWLPLLRVDYWAMLFSLLGLFIYLISPRAWSIALIMFALASLTKVTALAAPLACVIDLVFQRRLKRAFAMAAGIAGVYAACALYKGNSFSFHQFQTHPEPYSILRALAFYLSGAASTLLPIIIILYSATQGFRLTPANRLGWLYLAACSATTLTVGNPGSGANHLLEWSAAVCVVTALALGHMIEQRDPLKWVFTSALTAIAALSCLWAGSPLISQIEQGGCAEAYDFIHWFPGNRVLSEDVTPLILAGKPVLVSNPYVTTQLGSTVNWSQGSMGQLAAREYFDLIVLGSEIDTYKQHSVRWPPTMLEAIRQHYRLVRRFDCPPQLGAAYVPKSPARSKP